MFTDFYSPHFVIYTDLDNVSIVIL